MAQFQSPETYINGQQVTASRMNNMVNGAVALPGLIYDQSPLSPNTVAVGDYLLMYDASTSSLVRILASDLLGSNLPITTTSFSTTALTSPSGLDISATPSTSTAVAGSTYTSADGLTVNVSTLAAHNMTPSQVVIITGAASGYNGTFRLTYAAGSSFTYVMTAAATPGTGTLTFQRSGTLNIAGNIIASGVGYVDGKMVIGGSLTVGGTVTLNTTDAIKIPVGTTAQRPAAPVTGQMRFNSTTSKTELYNGTTWEEVGGGPFDGTGGNQIIAPSATIVSATFTSANGESVVVSSAAHGVVPGQVVRVTTAVAGYSGDWTVTSANTNDFTFVMTTAAAPNSGSCTYKKAGNYKCHIFTSSGSFVAGSKAGNVEVLVVGGGGGGAQGGQYNGGGGGGAVCYYPYYSVSSGQTISVTVGAGGAVNTAGSASVFGTITAGGGGAGAGGTGGASGVGGVLCPSNAGGSAASVSTTFMGGGGGGAGKAGQNGIVGGSALPEGGDGGDGKGTSITGIAATYGGGGGCGGRYTGVGVYSATGSNGGGNAGTSAAANTGGGGGGAPYTSSGGAGGSGIVIVRYPTW